MVCSFLKSDLSLIVGHYREMDVVLVKHQNLYYKLSITEPISVNHRYLHFVSNFRAVSW